MLILFNSPHTGVKGRKINMNSTFSLLEKLSEGWGFPYRAKKAHYFINRKSLCNKHNISEYGEGRLLPQVNWGEHCKKCLLLKTKEK